MTKSITLNYTLAVVGAVAMVLATVAPAFAAINSTSITLSITNRGSINNVTTSDSDTGNNVALGSLGGIGGNGGNVTSAGSENNGGAQSGNGGNGGNGGAGGWVETGDATSNSSSENGLNGTNAEVEFLCDCGDVNSVTIDLEIDNDREFPTQNNINNLTDARARTGVNTALGSQGGDAGNGGVIDGGAGSENNGGATSGTGGAGGAGGLGGTVATGNASSTSRSVNLLNTTLLRVAM